MFEILGSGGVTFGRQQQTMISILYSTAIVNGYPFILSDQYGLGTQILLPKIFNC